MRSTLSKATALAAVLALAAAACSSNKAADGAANETTADGKTVITVFSPSDPTMNLDTNRVTKLMSDKFKIQFKWQTTTFDSGPAKEKRQISLASGDYPALFFLIPWVDAFTQAEVLKLGTQGVALPLEQLIKDNAPNIQKALDSNKTYKEMSTAPDGHIYALPQWADCYHCNYPDKLWMNSAWLKKLGLQQPRTTEELRTVLEAFKTKDPNGNGKADEIPMTSDPQDSSLIAYLMGAFAYDPVGANNGQRSLLTLNGDKVTTPVNTDAWRQGLKYINSLYKEGLIDQAAFTQNAQALQAQGNNPKAVVLGSVPVLWPGIFVQLGSKDGRDKQYDAVPPLTGPDGKSYTGLNYPTSTGYTFMLTNKASKEAQVAAIKMLDYIYTDEGQEIANMGPEGVGWTKPGPGDIALDAKTKPLYKPIQGDKVPKNISWGAMGQYNNTLAYRNAQVVPTDIYSEAGLERRLFQATKLYQGHEDKAQWFPQTSVWPDPSLSGELATLQTNLSSYVNQNQLAFITGSKNIDTGWDAYVKGLDSTGMTRYLQIQQQAYDKYKAGSK
ncbi:putative aldouronate transport system substrate-binding protein [Kribbella voronezhensis]|uniref:Putative aldouronate transport system substrate-binding protein n=1 Tax=Kribbella voronezhensis TaxID=2512212 RepID=A0A4R7T8P1_9ACTN|nr:extracellular solute-binding protein [Kribbella voronezhensis]TDU87527.1 putative aldouronate transport system substrate-binding protein [Kribbella voronezhensis]